MSSNTLSRKGRRAKKEAQTVTDEVLSLTSIAAPTSATTALTPVPANSSSLASVVRKRGLTWDLADDDLPVTLFHKKFWGKSMKDEESEWRKSQMMIDQPEDMYDDERDDDIISGCYALDLNIPRMLVTSLWIRADYIRIFDHFQAFYDEYATPMEITPCGVLSGQPGIGKSVWIYYAARRCAAETKPFIWYYQSICYLFVNEGVYIMPDKWIHDDFRYIVWTLVDSDECDRIPSHFIPRGSLMFVIYATSPSAVRWSKIHKTMRRKVVIMNPWGRKEIKRAANLTSFKNVTENHIDEIFDLLGPIPRLCIDSTSDELEQYKTTLNTELSKITVDKIEMIIRYASILSMDAVSRKICLVSRKQWDDISSLPIVTPITSFIQSRLSIRFRNLHRDEQIRLYKYFKKVPELRAMAGIFYEAIVQSYLQDGRILRLVPMVTLETKKKRERSGDKSQIQWYSSHISIHNPALETCRLKVSNGFEVNIRPKHILEYTDNEWQSRIEPNVFYIPEMTNQKALDSFILLDDGLLYIFQIAFGMQQDIHHGFIDVADKYTSSFPPRDQWRFVFIIPPNMTLTVPRPWRLTLRNLSPYSAVVDVDPAQVQ